jgi:hypothetical protein
MKLKLIPFLIGFVVSLLLAYGFYELGHEPNRTIQTIGGGIFVLSTVTFLLGVDFQNARTSTNVRVVSSIFFLVALLSNILFALTSFSLPLYVIAEGIMAMTYLLIVYLISKADA